jgi:hypothetical protein
MKGCRMKADLHSVDPKFASMVPADEEVELVHEEQQEEGVQVPSGNGYLW